MEKYITLEKQVGQTPLSCAEAWRAEHPQYADVPLAYAGRLDPMASGKLLVLIGDECKNQTDYHGLDKAYDFSVLLGIGSDTHDVLGRLETQNQTGVSERLRLGQAPRSGLEESLSLISSELEGEIELPYPHFSAKTVQGKPLHMWTLEGRSNEIKIPTKASTIYSLNLTKIEILSREAVCNQARTKIDSIPVVTDPKKALGNDFRRVDVRKDWENIKNDPALPEEYVIAHFHCIASSGTYMRTLAKIIGEKIGTPALAWHIHRTNIGKYSPDTESWKNEF